VKCRTLQHQGRGQYGVPRGLELSFTGAGGGFLSAVVSVDCWMHLAVLAGLDTATCAVT
jgi:hypothetical protein